MEKQVVFWIFIAIFSTTAVITLLGITNVIKIQKNYLNALFTALILEVVGAVVLLFKSNYLSAATLPAGTYLSAREFLARTGADTTGLSTAKAEVLLAEKLETLIGLESERGNLNLQLQQAKAKLDSCSGNLATYDRSFFSKIIRLRSLIGEYDGFINLAYRPEEKAQAYQLLVEILAAIGKVKDEQSLYIANDNRQFDLFAVRKLYLQYRESYGRPPKEPHLLYIDEYDTVQMVREYLAQTENAPGN